MLPKAILFDFLQEPLVESASAIVRRTPANDWARLSLAALCIVQMLGISGAVVAAAIDIESIVASGPIFSVFGFVLAAIGWKTRRSRNSLYFGLSAAVMTVAVFLLIFLLRWSPSDAQYPVPLILIAYEYLIAPLAILSVYELRRGHSVTTSGPISFQFGLRHLLLATTFLAIVFAAIRLAMTGHALVAASAPGATVLAGSFWALGRARRPTT